MNEEHTNTTEDVTDEEELEVTDIEAEGDYAADYIEELLDIADLMVISISRYAITGRTSPFWPQKTMRISKVWLAKTVRLWKHCKSSLALLFCLQPVNVHA